MRLVVQRVSHASVKVSQDIVGNIEKGFLVFVGITHTDTEKDIKYLVDKLINLRIFEDENYKMNLSLQDVKGELLLISQFTLYGDCSHGRRPSFIEAARPDVAKELYEKFVSECMKYDIKVEKGIFQADMKVELLNDGPVTILLESK